MGDYYTCAVILLGVSATLSRGALGETVAVAVHPENVAVVGDAIEQRAGEALGSDRFGPFIKWQVAGNQGGTAFVGVRDQLEE